MCGLFFEECNRMEWTGMILRRRVRVHAVGSYWLEFICNKFIRLVLCLYIKLYGQTNNKTNETLTPVSSCLFFFKNKFLLFSSLNNAEIRINEINWISLLLRTLELSTFFIRSIDHSFYINTGLLPFAYVYIYVYFNALRRHYKKLKLN